MRFSKYYQPKTKKGGRKPSSATIAKREAETKKAYKKELKAFEAFENAAEGAFDGFEFINVFHQKVDKYAAILTAVANDEADVLTPFGKFHTGSDGITCYFFSEKPTKTVRFNRSIYYF